MKADVLRILTETYHSMGEQAMAEYYLAKIPAVHFFHYEIAAAILRGRKRIDNIEKTEELCIEKLFCVLWMRREEADGAKRTEIDRQAREMFAFFRNYPSYTETVRIMERRWNEGTIPKIYQ